MIYFGIDTGVNTGLAEWDSRGKRFRRIITTGIVGAMDIVARTKADGEDVTVVIEDARLRTWIPREKSVSQFKGRAMGAGSVKRDCAVWAEFCAFAGLPLCQVAPKYNNTKLDAETFARITGWTARTSEHARDAAMLVFGK